MYTSLWHYSNTYVTFSHGNTAVWMFQLCTLTKLTRKMTNFVDIQFLTFRCKQSESHDEQHEKREINIILLHRFLVRVALLSIFILYTLVCHMIFSYVLQSRRRFFIYLWVCMSLWYLPSLLIYNILDLRTQKYPCIDQHSLPDWLHRPFCKTINKNID